MFFLSPWTALSLGWQQSPFWKLILFWFLTVRLNSKVRVARCRCSGLVLGLLLDLWLLLLSLDKGWLLLFDHHLWLLLLHPQLWFLLILDHCLWLLRLHQGWLLLDQERVVLDQWSAGFSIDILFTLSNRLVELVFPKSF